MPPPPRLTLPTIACPPSLTVTCFAASHRGARVSNCARAHGSYLHWAESHGAATTSSVILAYNRCAECVDAMPAHDPNPDIARRARLRCNKGTGVGHPVLRSAIETASWVVHVALVGDWCTRQIGCSADCTGQAGGREGQGGCTRSDGPICSKFVCVEGGEKSLPKISR